MNWKSLSLLLLVVTLTLAQRSNGRGNNRDSDREQSERGRRGNFGELTFADVNRIKRDLSPIIEGEGTAHALRVSFHDCVGLTQFGRRTCDGCLNRDNRQNKGRMLITLKKMDDLYDRKYSRVLSRADYYALGGIFAVEQAVRYNNQRCTDDCMPTPDMVFLYGREDCPTSPNEPELIDFPSGHLNYTGTIGFFRDEFGMDERESVAAMGGHTLGGAAESGFIGFWKGNAEEAKRFNNEFYQLLIDPNIKYENVNKQFFTNFDGTRFQWDGFRREGRRLRPASFMLNADVCLLKDIQTNARRQSLCSFVSCERSPTAEIVEEYARDPQAFMSDYSRAYEKIVNKGYDNGRLLRLPRGTCPSSIGPDRVIFDDECVRRGGGLGCNAGGIDIGCKFCGGRGRDPCPP